MKGRYCCAGALMTSRMPDPTLPPGLCLIAVDFAACLQSGDG